ncbi:hypothetical protein ACJ41P_10395 [Azospirillum argentinense]|uniref:Uncharacterized protein n=1 Tax=Azospirillum argentinense TaxID=2970906 RepID=A0ABW8VAP3_9PROT
MASVCLALLTFAVSCLCGFAYSATHSLSVGLLGVAALALTAVIVSKEI